MALPTLAVEFAPTNTPLATAPTWVDITAYALDFETSRGFGNELDTVADAGTVSITLDNRDRRFDPTYAAGPYFGNLVAGKQLRIRATYNAVTYDVFKGHIEGYPQTYPGGMFNTECTLQCVDGKQYLANAVLENDTVVSGPGKMVHAKWARGRRRGPERDVREPLEDLSQYSDLIQYSKPVMYWPVSGDLSDETVSAAAGDRDLRRQKGQRTAATVDQLGTGELVQGDEYPPASMSLQDLFNGYFQTDNLDFPDYTSLTVECVFQLTTLPSTSGVGYRLVSGPMDSGNNGPIFTIFFDTADDLNCRVRLTDNTNYTWTLTNAPAINTTYHAALVYDGAAGTIGAYFNGAGGSGATGAGVLSLDDPGATNRNVYVGGHPGAASGQYPKARIQHVAIYNRVLTTTTLLAHKNAISLGFPTGDSATTRIAAILDAVSWPASWRDLNSGTSATLIGRRYSNQSAMDEINTTEAANFGRFWLGPDGFVVTYERDWRNHADFSSSAATIGDDPTENRYNDIGVLESNDDTRISRVLCKSAADETVQMSEDAAITPPITLDLGEVILDTAASASSLASALVTRYKTPQPRFKEITIEPETDPTNLWPKVLGYDLCKQVTVKRRPKGSADTAISQASHIERISHRCTVSTGNWVTTWTVSPR